MRREQQVHTLANHIIVVNAVPCKRASLQLLSWQHWDLSGGCRQSCEASAHPCGNVQHGYFPSNTAEKLQWMATCFCKQFARNFAVSPDRLCVALFSNHSQIHWFSRYLLQIPAVCVFVDQSRFMLHLLPLILFKIQGVQGISALWILSGLNVALRATQDFFLQYPSLLEHGLKECQL